MHRIVSLMRTLRSRRAAGDSDEPRRGRLLRVATLLVAALGAAGMLAACGDDDSTATTPTIAGITATPGSSSTAGASVGASSTAGATPSSTSTGGASPTAGPQNAKDVATSFFTAWLKGDSAGMAANGEGAALTTAAAVTPGTGWVFSECDAAAGSLGCVWVKAEQRTRVRVRSIQPPVKVVEFDHGMLAPQDTAQEFFAAWQAGSSDAVKVLSEGDATTAALAAQAQAGAGWSFQSCQGAAGSVICTWTHDAATLTVRIRNIEPPRVVTSFAIT